MKILFVCLGNICRSPAAEGVFLNLLKKRDMSHLFVVDSAGTGSWHIGRPPDKRMQTAANRRGIELPSKARQITPNDVRDFDLILTMDEDNFQAVQQLARGTESADTVNIKPIMSFTRTYIETEVPDPYYGKETGFEHVLDMLEEACSSLLDELSRSIISEG